MTINKILDNFNAGVHKGYDNMDGSPQLSLTKINTIVDQADLIYAKSKKVDIKWAIIPICFESFEILIDDFVRSYKHEKGYKLTIDIYYASKLDIKRDF